MDTSEVTKPTSLERAPPQQASPLPADELKRLTDFFSILIRIDQRVNATKNVCKTK